MMQIERLLGLDPSSLIMKRASSGLGMQELIERITKSRGSAKGCTLQIFDTGAIVSKEHLVTSYINAKASFAEKSNRAGSMSIEMLLFAAMTRQISEAIEKVGAKSSKSFIIFSDSARAFSTAKKYLKSPADFKPTAKESLSAARKLGIDAKSVVDANETVLRNVTLSKLRQ